MSALDTLGRPVALSLRSLCRARLGKCRERLKQQIALCVAALRVCATAVDAGRRHAFVTRDDVSALDALAQAAMHFKARSSSVDGA